MKLWIFIECPRCGFHGCTVPLDEAPCPRCGFARSTDAPNPVRRAS